MGNGLGKGDGDYSDWSPDSYLLEVLFIDQTHFRLACCLLGCLFSFSS